MADDTDWNSLKAKCAEHECSLILRAETINDAFRFSLSARDKHGATIYDQRANDDGHAPQFVVTGLVGEALSQWWL